MAIGKNKRLTRGGKRSKKKIVEPMTRKEWYDVIAPSAFKVRQFAKTIANKTIGTRSGVDNVKGRVYEACLADLSGSSERDEPFRRMKFVVHEVQGRNLLTQFHGMHLTKDRVRSMLRKWCTTIESTIEAKTADGYHLRLFVICFTRKQKGQLSKNCYAKTRLIKWVRHRMVHMVQRRLAKRSITQCVNDLTRDVLADAMLRRCNPIVPLRDVKIYKVKVIRAPKLDLAELHKCHGDIPSSNEGQAQAVEVAADAADAPETAAPAAAPAATA